MVLYQSACKICNDYEFLSESNVTDFELQFYCFNRCFQLSIGNHNLELSGGPSFNIVCGASNRILRKSASGMASDKAPVSMSLSMFNSRNPLENRAFYAYFLMADLLTAGGTL